MNGRERLARGAALALSLLLIGCGSDSGNTVPPPDVPLTVAQELALAGLGIFSYIEPERSEQNGDWEEYFYEPNAEDAICMRGTPYQVNLRRGNSDKVLLYQEGGGACWNRETCWTVPIAKPEAGSAPGGGILDTQNPENPFADWNVIYAPYCDGSVFAGNQTVDYGDDPALRTHHNGLANLSAAVNLMVREFPRPEQIVVAGSSAGGFGTYTGYGVTRVNYPRTEIAVLNDSGPGIQNPNNAETIEERAANWGFERFVPVSCTRCGEQLTYLTEWALERDDALSVGYFNYLQDNVLRFFLSIDAQGFESLLRSVTGDVRNRHPTRFRRFFKNGSTHTILLSGAFYTLTVDGTTMRDWTDGLLNDGAAWQDLVE